mmetsp:Transcript_91294/g.254348  ORF Transcript_91294/g.254348 Transcript_91294/m.254348 type:complete len:116 (+) Transcript_91294:50-397(+)
MGTALDQLRWFAGATMPSGQGTVQRQKHAKSWKEGATGRGAARLRRHGGVPRRLHVPQVPAGPGHDALQDQEGHLPVANLPNARGVLARAVAHAVAASRVALVEDLCADVVEAAS